MCGASCRRCLRRRRVGLRVLGVHLYLYPLREIKDGGLGPAMAEAIDGLKSGNVPCFHRYKR